MRLLRRSGAPGARSVPTTGASPAPPNHPSAPATVSLSAAPSSPETAPAPANRATTPTITTPTTTTAVAAGTSEFDRSDPGMSGTARLGDPGSPTGHGGHDLASKPEGATTGSPTIGSPTTGSPVRRRGSVTIPSVVAGLLMALSLPPWGWWPLALVGAGLFWWRLGGLPARARFVAGWALGIGVFVPGLWWALSFNVYGGAVLMAVEALTTALAALLTPSGRGRLLALPGAMLLAEALRDTWPFGGLPMGSVTLGQAAGPLAVASRLGGPLLLVGAVWLAGAGVGALVMATMAAMRRSPLERRRMQPSPVHEAGGPQHSTARGAGRQVPAHRPDRLRSPVRLAAAGAAAAAVVVAVTLAGALGPDGGPTTTMLRVAAVQGGGRRGVSQAEVAASTVFAAQLAATAAVPTSPSGRKPSLVVWPEDVVALPGPLAGSPAEQILRATAQRLQATMVVGVTEDVGATRFRNEAVTVSPSGAILGHYEKVHRVPFGEYVPYRSFFAHLANLSAVPRDAIPGHGDGVLHTPVATLGTMISFEVFFSDRGRDPVRHGADLLVVPTNTSSYVTGQVPSQEVAADRLQAIAEGRYLVQAAPTGYSDVVTPNGAVLARSLLGRRSVLLAGVGLRHGMTVFARTGSLPAELAAAGCVVTAWVMVAAGRRRRRRGRRTRPQAPSR